MAALIGQDCRSNTLMVHSPHVALLEVGLELECDLKYLLMETNRRAGKISAKHDGNTTTRENIGTNDNNKIEGESVLHILNYILHKIPTRPTCPSTKAVSGR